MRFFKSTSWKSEERGYRLGKDKISEVTRECDLNWLASEPDHMGDENYAKFTPYG